LSYSFAEANQEKFVVIVEIEPDQAASYSKIPLQSGRAVLRQKFTEVAEALKWLNENPNCLVELTISTEEFLSASDKNALTKAHDGLIAIIPEIKNTNSPHHLPQIDLSKNINELFHDFFSAKTGQAPNPELMNNFNEIMALNQTDPEDNL
jgi:exonuclease SbcD